MINHDPPLINLSKVQWLIIDEADKLFEVSFENRFFSKFLRTSN